jgi:HD-GYP domain-containing protein (c-di-GMP phosphodiesterase class II)
MTNDVSVADLRFREVAEAMVWIFDQVRSSAHLPVMEAKAAASALYVALRREGKGIVPQMALHDMSAYPVVHCINVALLAMGAAEALKLEDSVVRTIGLAGLLYDIGMVRVPDELNFKAAELSEDERAIMMRHPVDGAVIILEADGSLDLAAVTAYEHHIRVDGTGYPAMVYRRASHQISRLIAVCDSYHALSCPRPFRAAWPADAIVSFLLQRSDVDYDAEMIAAVTNLTLGGGTEVQGRKTPPPIFR